MIDMLCSLIKLNPYFRKSASEIIKDSIFDDLRLPMMEKSAPFKLRLEVDQDDAFDFEKGISLKYDMNDYRTIVECEAQIIH